jgi:NADH-quinone oxidoreductase subunit L
MGVHHWLPDAMEGPTQVSALIHAATLVIAGVYVACKLSPVITWLPFCIVTTAASGVASYSLLSVCCLDSKRLIAFSTGWHVALLCILLLLGVYFMCAHVITHAMYKAALFVSVG